MNIQPALDHYMEMVWYTVQRTFNGKPLDDALNDYKTHTCLSKAEVLRIAGKTFDEFKEEVHNCILREIMQRIRQAPPHVVQDIIPWVLGYTEYSDSFIQYVLEVTK